MGEPTGTIDVDLPRGHRAILCTIGAVQGLIYWLVLEHWPDAAGHALAAAVATFATAFALAVQFAWTGRDRARLLGLAAGIAGVLALSAFWVWAQIPTGKVAYQGDYSRVTTWGPAAFIVLYVVEPYLQILQRTGRWRFPYPDLFFHSWCNFFIGLMGAVFLGVLWLLLWLWEALFAMIGIAFFKDLFTSPWFACVVSTTIFAYGIATGRESSRIIDAREAVLAVFRFLLPVLAAMTLLFVAALLVTGVQPLWKAGASSRLLLALVGFAILFLNAVFEDGRREPPYPPWLRHAVSAAVLALPLLAAAALYALDLRIRQYGLTLERFVGVVVAVIALLYGLGYASAVVVPRRGPWLGLMRAVNVALSFVVVAVALLLHSPVLDPMTWSARSQYVRLASGRADPEHFDYAYLRFKLGHVGFETLAKLESLEGHPRIAAIRDGVARARSLAYYRGRLPAPPLSAKNFVLVGSLAAIPEGLLEALSPGFAAPCATGRGCYLFAVDLRAGDVPQYCLATPYTISCYSRAGAKWEYIGQLLARPGAKRFSAAQWSDFLVSLQRDGAVPVPAEYRDVGVGDYRFSLHR